jgi:hypothetical protein
MMNKLITFAVACAAVSGCFYPYSYFPAPGYHYVPGAGPSVQVYPPAAPPPAAVQPATPAPSSTLETQAAHEARLRELQAKRDEAQRALDLYAAQGYRSPAVAMRPAYPVTVRQPLSSLGLSIGARALNTPIDDHESLLNVGLGLSHRIAGTSVSLDFAVANAGFIEVGELTDRVFTGLEFSAGLRLTGAQPDAGRAGYPYQRGAWYVGGGSVALEIIDTVEDSFTGAVIAESTASASGSYVCAGIHYQGNSIGSSEVELRQVMGTTYSTYGSAKSSDGVELLFRLAFVF